MRQYAGHPSCRSTGVAEIGRELWQKALDVLTCAIPREQPMNSRGMAKIVEAWWPWLTRRTHDASGAA
jgi:hypothetical protein